jgi:pantoate kinase
VYFNDEIVTFPTVVDGVKKLTSELFEIRLTSPFPLGSGFGLSGAATLATLHAINHRLNLKKNEMELALFAHQSEIENGTGLGTVATEITGGFLLKSESGIPVSAVQLPFTGQKLYTVILGPILTSTVLKNVSAITKNNRAADKALRLIHSLLHPTLSDIIDVSLDYILETGFLTKKTKDVVDMIKDQNIHATMAILGDVIICDKKPSGLDGHRIEELMITRDTVSVIKE